MRLQRRGVAQDCLLQPLHLRRRLQSELFVEAEASVLVRLERVGLPAAPIKGQHRQAQGPLPRRMLRYQLFEFAHDESMLARLDPDVDPVLVRDGAQLFKPGDLPLRERLERHVDEGRTTPQR